MLDISSKQLNYILQCVHTECKSAQTLVKLFSVDATSKGFRYRFECRSKKHPNSEFVLFVNVPHDLPQILCEASSSGITIFNCDIHYLCRFIMDAYKYGTV